MRNIYDFGCSGSTLINARRYIIEGKDEAIRELIRIGSDCEVADLYWGCPEIPAEVFTDVRGYRKPQWQRFLSTHAIDIAGRCLVCSGSFLITIKSREDVEIHKMTGGFTGVCDDCYTAEFDLKTMPYKQYLQTQHWQRVRERALEAANRRCQVCNARNNLNVHHRTYDRRGCELPTDVIVLCYPCHNLFHKNGKLVTW